MFEAEGWNFQARERVDARKNEVIVTKVLADGLTRRFIPAKPSQRRKNKNYESWTIDTDGVAEILLVID
jgi:hypothetical protein